MLKAVKFDILRDVCPRDKVSYPAPVQPLYVGALLDEKAFDEDHYLVHRKTIFMESQLHDWDWSEGRLRYYSPVFTQTDVLVVYETKDVLFDPMTGKRLDSE